jgi:glycolate oxidase
MNRILSVDEMNHQVRVQPGVIVQELQEEVQSAGFFMLLTRLQEGTCTIGGNIAEKQRRTSCSKYGVTKDWVLNLGGGLIRWFCD